MLVRKINVQNIFLILHNIFSKYTVYFFKQRILIFKIFNTKTSPKRINS